MLLYGALIVISMASCCLSKFNLYLDYDEVEQLIGVNSQIWYARNGTVNDYALGYIVIVPPQIDNLTFWWQAFEDWKIPYNLSVEVADREALSPPVLNIDEHGLVPTRLSPWSLSIPCTGKSTSLVDLSITLNVQMTASSTDPTTVKILRKKRCLKDSKPKDTKDAAGNRDGSGVDATQSKGSSKQVKYLPVLLRLLW